MRRILLVDDEPLVLTVLHRLLERDGYEVVPALGGEKGRALFEEQSFDLMISDIRMAPISGIELLRLVHAERPLMPVLLVTGYAELTTAMEALNLGAFDYIEKPIRPEEFLISVRRALNCGSFVRINEYFRDQSVLTYRLEDVVAESNDMRRVCDQIERISLTDEAVLIRGERGVGKKLMARTIHGHGRRADKTFVSVNCAELPEPLLELALFGKGEDLATLKSQDEPGLFFAAGTGTLLLDEIEMMPQRLQTKLLGIIQEEESSAGRKKADMSLARIRIMATTRLSMEELEGGTIIVEELYRRFSGRILHLKSLRERSEDILPLIAHVLRRQYKNWDEIPTLTPEVGAILLLYSWPGNVEELKNVLAQMLRDLKTGQITREPLPKKVIDAAAVPDGKKNPYFGRGEYWARSLRAFLRNRLNNTVFASAGQPKPALPLSS